MAYPDVPVFQTAADVVGAGTATARSQYYGSANNRSLWLGGMFDYRGLSDYTPMEDQASERCGVEYSSRGMGSLVSIHLPLCSQNSVLTLEGVDAAHNSNSIQPSYVEEIDPFDEDC